MMKDRVYDFNEEAMEIVEDALSDAIEYLDYKMRKPDYNEQLQGLSKEKTTYKTLLKQILLERRK